MSTTGKLKKSSASKAIDRPFNAAIIAKARALVEHYQLVMWFENGEWYAHGLEFPNAGGDGRTAEECVKQTREAMTVLAAYMLEKGQIPPAPASENIRNEQVNLRLSQREKLLLETAAGAESISDFVRAAALAAAGR